MHPRTAVIAIVFLALVSEPAPAGGGQAARRERKPRPSGVAATIPVTAAMRARGRELYSARCASCHAPGSPGAEGGGRSAEPRAGDLAAVAVDRLSDMDIARFIQFGGASM